MGLVITVSIAILLHLPDALTRLWGNYIDSIPHESFWINTARLPYSNSGKETKTTHFMFFCETKSELEITLEMSEGLSWADGHTRENGFGLPLSLFVSPCAFPGSE